MHSTQGINTEPREARTEKHTVMLPVLRSGVPGPL